MFTFLLLRAAVAEAAAAMVIPVLDMAVAEAALAFKSASSTLLAALFIIASVRAGLRGLDQLRLV
jgi:hypothetical protein